MSHQMNVKKIFGENLRYYRKKAGLTQEEFAEKIGVGSVHIGNLEVGKKFVSADMLETISAALNVSPSALFYSPDVISEGDNFLDKIDSILNDHVAAMRKEIREIAK